MRRAVILSQLAGLALVAACAPRGPVPEVAVAWSAASAEMCPSVEVQRTDLSEAPGHWYRTFVGCGGERICVLVPEVSHERLVYYVLDPSGRVLKRAELAMDRLPPERFNHGERRKPALHATVSDTDIVLIHEDWHRVTRVERYTPEGVRQWSSVIDGVPPVSIDRIMVDGSTVAALTAHANGALTFFDRASGSMLGRQAIEAGGATPWAACLTKHKERWFVGSLYSTNHVTEKRLQGVVYGSWIDPALESVENSLPVFIPEIGEGLDCTAQGPEIGVVSLSSTVLSYWRLDARGSLSVPVRTVARHPKEQWFNVTHLLASSDLTFVAWEYRPWNIEHVGTPEAWVSVLDGEGRPTYARHLGRGTRNVALTPNGSGVMAVFENGKGKLSVAHVGCDRGSCESENAL